MLVTLNLLNLLIYAMVLAYLYLSDWLLLLVSWFLFANNWFVSNGSFFSSQVFSWITTETSKY